MSTRRLTLTAYDCCSPARLRRALAIATELSHGGQKSVHECWTSGSEMHRLARDLSSTLVECEDRWALFSLGRNPHVHVLGRGRAPADPPVMFFGWEAVS